MKLKRSVFYQKCFRLVCGSVALATVGLAVYAVLRDCGLIPDAGTALPEGEAEEIVARIREKYLGGSL